MKKEPMPENLWTEMAAFARDLVLKIQRERKQIAHVEAMGTLAAGIALMKGTGASEEIVMAYAREMYRHSKFRFLD